MIFYHKYMKTLGIKNKTKYCYSICENSIEDCIEIAKKLSNEKNIVLELRIDYLLCKHINILEIISLIRVIKMFCKNNKILATIRTNFDGGKIKISKNTYYNYICELYNNSLVDAIDVEYKYYKKDCKTYTKLFNKKQKEIILSSHIFDKKVNNKKNMKILNGMIRTNADIIKFAIKITCMNDLFTYMYEARKKALDISKNGKKLVFIAMGEIGRISRVWNEFTLTKLVFISAYNKIDRNIGQLTKNSYLLCRKALAKILKNC